MAICDPHLNRLVISLARYPLHHSYGKVEYNNQQIILNNMYIEVLIVWLTRRAEELRIEIFQ